MTAPLELVFERAGAGRPVVILHGLFGSKRNWRSHATKLAEHYDVVTVDLRNHGESPHSDSMDYAAMAADIGHLLRQLDLDDVALVGHSMGGKAAMTYALTDAARIGQLIVVDIAPRAYPNEYIDMLRGMRELDLDAITRRSAADTALEPAIPDPGIRAFILQNLRFGGDAPRWQFNLDAIERHIGDLIGEIPVAANAIFERPVCCLRGERSDRVGARDGDAMTRFFPAFSLLTIPAAGHWPHAENPPAFAKRLHEVLVTAAV